MLALYSNIADGLLGNSQFLYSEYTILSVQLSCFVPETCILTSSSDNFTKALSDFWYFSYKAAKLLRYRVELCYPFTLN